MEKKRSFTIVHVEDVHGKAKGAANLGGRFLSSSPASAAKKAGTQICRASAIRGRCTLIVTIRETTAGSKHKQYVYKVSRVHAPTTVVRNGVEIVYEYKTEVKSMKASKKSKSPKKSAKKSASKKSKSPKKSAKKSASKKSKSPKKSAKKSASKKSKSPKKSVKKSASKKSKRM
jgi:PHD/YefM family antitoxin component YafN of YafNO toxin-antitoxin module